MGIANYEDMNALEVDVIKEIGSIGTGNAATALSQVLKKTTKMSLPAVSWVTMKPLRWWEVQRKSLLPFWLKCQVRSTVLCCLS